MLHRVGGHARDVTKYGVSIRTGREGSHRRKKKEGNKKTPAEIREQTGCHCSAQPADVGVEETQAPALESS